MTIETLEGRFVEHRREGGALARLALCLAIFVGAAFGASHAFTGTAGAPDAGQPRLRGEVVALD